MMRAYPLLIVPVLLVAGCSIVDNYGAEVFIENVGTAPLTGVDVVVTGATYSLKPIPPGETRSVKVYPKGESSLSLVLTDEAGQSTQLDVNVYFESGYRGRLDLKVTQSELVEFNHEPLSY
ncbi:MAG: hypothetical protein AAFU71_01275 [Cyanobacteria bacterium J06632_22]